MKIELTPMTEDWRPIEKIIYECHETFGKELDIEYEILQFRDHYIATGSTYANWNIRFRAWCRQSARWSRERGTQKPTETISEQRSRISGVVDQRNGKTNSQEKSSPDSLQKRHIKAIT